MLLNPLIICQIMDASEADSTNTSVDDKTDDFCENPTRDTLAEGLMTLLKPALDQLDDKVKTVRSSLGGLTTQLEGLNEELGNIAAEQSFPVELEHYISQLNNSRHKITVVSNILQAAQDRLNKLQNQINKETAKRKALAETYPEVVQ